MNKDTQVKLVKEMDEELLRIFESKGNDYAGEDVLQNFKQMSEVARILNIDCTTSIGYALFMCLLKIQRTANLLASDKIPNNEGIEDSMKDHTAYSKLAYLLYIENTTDVETPI